MLAAAEAMNAGLEVIKPEMEKRKSQTKNLGIVVIELLKVTSTLSERTL